MIQADDRRELAKVQTGKTSKWPRTPRREQRIREVLSRRQSDLTIVLENVHDSRNVSAVLRSCDAVGILGVHTIYSVDQQPEHAFSRKISGSAAKWIEVEHHASVADCYATLRANGFTIFATALRDDSVDLFDLDLARPVAIVFGNEMRGVSDEARDLADGTIKIPMMGMIESLNISVACAVCLFEAMRQRRRAGVYDRQEFEADLPERLVTDWLSR